MRLPSNRTLTAILLLVAASCSDSGQPRARFLSIATGGTGGVYYPYGGGLAKVLNENLPDVRATAEVTAASVDNLKLIRDGKADIAFVLADTLADAVAGRGPFDGRPVPAASLAVLYSNYTHIVTTARAGSPRSPICAARPCRPAHRAAEPRSSPCACCAPRASIPDRDVTRQGLGATESAGALKDGKIAAFVWTGGLPTAAIQDLAHSPGMTIRLIPSADILPALRRDVRRPVLPAGDSGRRLSRRRPAGAGRRRRQRPRRQPFDARRSGPRHHARAVREEGRAGRHPSRGCASLARARRRGVSSRVSSWCAAVLRRALTPTSRHSVPSDAFHEHARRTLPARARQLATGLSIGLSLYSLYWVLFIVQPQIYRVSFLLVALVLIFLLFPARSTPDPPARATALDWALVGAAVVALSWPILDFSRFIYRAADPLPVDVALGGLTILLVLEATRRSVGWILPATAIGFIVYGWAGPLFDRVGLVAHRASWLRARSPGRHALHDARGDLRRPARCRLDLHHPLHDLRRGARALGCGPLLHRLVDGRDGPVALRRGTWSHRHRRRVPPRHRVRQRCRDDGHARIGVVAPAARRGLPSGRGRRHSFGRGHRRAHLAAHAWRGGVPHRRVPQNLVPAGPRDGDHPDGPVLLLDPPDDRSRLPSPRHEGANARRRVGRHALPEVWLSLHLARRDRGLHDRGHVGLSRRLLGDGAGVGLELPAPGDRADAAAADGRARERRRSASSASAPPPRPPASSSAS